MAYQIAYTMKSNYLHALVTGENTFENTRAYLSDILRECRTRPCQRVLIEERLDGPRLSIMEVFQLATELSEKALDVIQVAAYVDVNTAGDNMKFAEDVAVNRGLFGRVFATVPEAEAWISKVP